MSTLERLQKEIARTRAEQEDAWADAIGLTADEAERLLAVVEAFKAMDLRCEREDVFVDEPACGDCEICTANALMAEL